MHVHSNFHADIGDMPGLVNISGYVGGFGAVADDKPEIMGIVGYPAAG